MKETAHPLDESLKGRLYYNLDWRKYFNSSGGTLGTPEEVAQTLSTEPPETVSTYYKLERVREFNNAEICRGGFGGVGNFAIVFYLNEHPEKTFSEALDPTIDPEEKHAYGVRAMNILAGLPEDMPENASKEEMDKYMQDGKPVVCEGYVDKMKDLIIKSHEVFERFDYGKEISYLCDAKGKNMSEILSDQDNVIHTFTNLQIVQKYMQQLHQSFTKACRAGDYVTNEKGFARMTTDETTKQIYREALDEMKASDFYDRYKTTKSVNNYIANMNKDAANFFTGYFEVQSPDFNGKGKKISDEERLGNYTYLYEAGKLAPDDPDNPSAEAEKAGIEQINNGNAKLAQKFAGSIKLWSLVADYSKLSEIPPEVFAYHESPQGTVFEGKMGPYLNDMAENISDDYKNITPVELFDMAMNHGQMASHYMFKGSEEIINGSFTSEQRKEVNDIVAGDKNLEPLANPDVLAAFAVTHTLSTKNLPARSVFTEKGLQQIDGKSTLDFLKNNPVTVTKTEGGKEVTTISDGAIKNIVNEGNKAYNSLKSYMFSVNADAKMRERQYYGLSELARFTENCGAAYSEIEKIKDKDGNQLYSCQLANTDDPIISNTHYISSMAASAIDCEDPYKALAGKIFMDELYPALDGKSMAQISELYPKDFFKNYAANTEAFLKANIPNLTRQEAMAYIEGKEVEKIRPQVINSATKGNFNSYQNNVIDRIATKLTERAFDKCGDAQFSMAYHDKLNVYLRQVLQANQYAQKCNSAEDQEKIRQTAEAFAIGGNKLGTYLPDFISNDMLRQASDLALTDLATQGIANSDLQPGELSSPYAEKEKDFVIDGKFAKQLANFNPKKLTVESLHAGMGFFDSMLKNMPELTEALKNPDVAANVKSSTDLFLIDGMSADEYLKKKMGRQYNKYSEAEKECLKKAMIAKAVSDGEPVVEAKQYFIDPVTNECEVAFTSLCNMDNPKSRKAVEKYNAKKADKVHADILKKDPVVAKYNEKQKEQAARSIASAANAPKREEEPAPEVEEPAPEMQEEKTVEEPAPEVEEPAPEVEENKTVEEHTPEVEEPEVEEPAPEAEEEKAVEEPAPEAEEEKTTEEHTPEVEEPEPEPEVKEPAPEVEENKTVEEPTPVVEQPAPENTASRHKDKGLSDMIAQQLNHGSGQLSKDVTNDEPSQKLTKDVPGGK